MMKIGNMKIIKMMKYIFFVILVGIAAALAVFLYARYIEPQMLLVSKVAIKSAKAKASFKVVFFSDVHIGRFSGEKELEKIVLKINEQEPDIIIFGGDFFDAYHNDKDILDIDAIAAQTAKLSAKYGKFALWGNHDYGGGSKGIYADFMQSANLKILRNETLQIDELGVSVTGLDDMLLGKPMLNTQELKSDYFNIAACHEPDVSLALPTENVELFLGGHSHGGQVNLPFITERFLPKGAKTYVRGMYQNQGKTGDTDVFVSRGIGMTKLPYRFASAPEIVVIEVSAE